MFCQKCGTKIPDNATACPSCSTPVPPAGPSPASVAADKVKAASKDAMQALKIFALNPIPGLPTAYQSLGSIRAQGAGMVFGVFSSLCLLLELYRFLGPFGRPDGVIGFIKLLIVCLVPFVSLWGAGLVVRLIFRGAGAIASDSFIAGAALLPTGLVALAAGILGVANMDVVALLALFAVCLTVLILFSGLTRICNLSERAATLALPLMLLLSLWLSKVIYGALFS